MWFSSIPLKDLPAHLNGYLTFLDECKAFVSKYPRAWHAAEIKYVESLARLLQEFGIEVVRMMEDRQEAIRGKGNTMEIDSARGIYVNFLRLNGTFILPQYSLEPPPGEDDLHPFNHSILAKYGEVRAINCDRLAEFGGVLHCISFTD